MVYLNWLIKRRLLFFVAGIGLATSAQANTCTDDLPACYEAAEEGIAEAQFYLGEKYYDEQSYTEAITWFKKAAEQGIAVAQYNVAQMYWFGKGVPQSTKEAIKWYTKAANQGYEPAQQALKKAGQFVCSTVDDCSVLARKGNKKAQLVLGEIYYAGIDVEQSYSKAALWFRKAADNGVVEAQINLSILYRDGLGVEKSLKKSSQWLRKAANNGSAEAQYGLGMRYFQAKGVGEDYDKGLMWVQKAADNGLAEAQKDIVELRKSVQDLRSAKANQNRTQTSRNSCRTADYGEQNAIWRLATVCDYDYDNFISYSFYCKNINYNYIVQVHYSKSNQKYYTPTDVGGFGSFYNFNEAAIATCAYYARQ